MVSLALAIGASGLSAMLITPLFIRILRRHGIGEEIREDGPERHISKRGTPTMGGVVIVISSLLGYSVAHLPFRRTVPISWPAILCYFVVVSMGALGVADDWSKARQIRKTGLSKSTKFLGQIAIASVFAGGAMHIGAPTTASFITGGIELGALFVPFALLVIAASSNSVNLTDGLDGLAAGAAGLVYAAYMFISFWQFNQRATDLYPATKALDAQLDMAIFAGSMFAACIGFLWWNAAPAKIFMGDAGALALGGGIAASAMMTSTPLLLPILGGLFVLETISVIVQVIAFRLFKRRVFLMAPVHHHFELKGWPEFTVIVRFWIISGLFVGLGLAIFYGDFLIRSGL
ncbi:MAG: phospho-N-acetylmuramoyl-pentapeptide-transferase [Acidimicrobiia bacterium]